MNESPVLLIERATNEVVLATLVEDVPLEQLKEVDRIWRPALEEIVQRLKEEGVPSEKLPKHGHWKWNEKGKYAREFPLTYRFFGIRVDGRMEALMMTAVDPVKVARIESQRNKPLVYVDYIESAPWNLPNLVSAPRFKGAGTVLLSAAIQQSRDEEFKGRIGLHALPDVEGWYAHCGMTNLGVDEDYYGLKYFEMTPEQANEFYPEGGE